MLTTCERMNDHGLMPHRQYFSHFMARTFIKQQTVNGFRQDRTTQSKNEKTNKVLKRLQEKKTKKNNESSS